jgi:hydroxymethylbilane synthase
MAAPTAKARKLRIGTRASKLARWQAGWVADRLLGAGQAVEVVEIATHADENTAVPISSFGGTGVFTKEVQRALLADRIDVAVHSMKDLPTERVDGILLAAVPLRENIADVLVTADGATLAQLSPAARVGTGSLRRQAQLRHVRPDLQLIDVRGNVDTRLRKLDEGQLDALVLAEAGLVRLGLGDRVAQALGPPAMLPAVGQGALAIECRTEDVENRDVLATLDDADTRAAVMAERAMLAHLRGGCLAPVGAWGRIEGGAIHLSAVVLSVDGKQRLEAHDQAKRLDISAAEQLGRRVAEILLSKGAADLIAASRQPRSGDKI